jgi:hypothetical protein
MNLMENHFLDKVYLTDQSSDSIINIVDQEEVELPEEKTMFLWDPNLLLTSDDVFDIQEPLAKILAMQMRSKGQLVSNDLTIVQSSRGKQTVDHLKSPFFSQRNPINIHTCESPKLDYNIVEDLKNLNVNVSIMDLCRIPQQKDFILQALNSIESPITSTDLGEVPSPIDPKNKPNVNTFSIDKKGNPFVPPFLLMFEVFNKNLHNCLVDSMASSNVMPLSICKNLNVVPLKSDKQVIQLNRT